VGGATLVIVTIVVFSLAGGSRGAASLGLGVVGVVILLAAVFTLRGLTAVKPGHAHVVQLFGRYTGTIREPGLQWVNPFSIRIPVSTRIRNTESALVKVNDADGNPIEIAAVIADRVASVGVTVVETRLTRLSYAPEIAQAMLRQQQASAVVGARQRIVEGAVGMVQLALRRLDEENVVELDEERKAAMVSNLLVVLCSEQATQQVVNTGSLYQ
jgi:regulator of protease activity HflC (stomatin/prohibitin superfamily)